MPRKKIVNIHQINGNNLTEKDHAFHIQHLEKGIRLIDSMSRRHSKVLQERVDLRYPQTVKSDGSNADFSGTLQNYTKWPKVPSSSEPTIHIRARKNKPAPFT